MKKSSATRNTSGLIALCLSFAIAAISIAFFIRENTRSIAVVDPVVVREIKQAKRLGKQGKWSKAAIILERNAKGSNPNAKLEYALLYTRGWGVTRDLERARNLLLQSVQRDFPARGRAAFELGRIYRNSRGKDCPRIAFEWFSKAVLWNYPKAHAELGKSYARGLGIEVNIERALHHYKAAAQYGSASAVVPLINLIARGSEAVEPNPDRAKRLLDEFLPLLERDANRGSAIAARTLGRLYQKSNLIIPNQAKAMHWYSIASSLGDAAAMHDLALLSMAQNKTYIDTQHALDLLRESAARGYSGAMTALGRLHLERQFNLKAADGLPG